jgi:putative (di)nucleoside polyphosphate hydrolase
MNAQDKLPYRRCAGVMLLNRQGLVFIGRRTGGPEHTDATHTWQMPQGGLDDGEDPYEGALRELYEETNVRSVQKLAEAKDWYAYDLPTKVGKEAWKGKYRGQTQKWFALRFTGDDGEINVTKPGGGKHKAEFVDWRWERMEKLSELIIPFKRNVYVQVVREFSKFSGRKP